MASIYYVQIDQRQRKSQLHRMLELQNTRGSKYTTRSMVTMTEGLHDSARQTKTGIVSMKVIKLRTLFALFDTITPTGRDLPELSCVVYLRQTPILPACNRPPSSLILIPKFTQDLRHLDFDECYCLRIKQRRNSRPKSSCALEACSSIPRPQSAIDRSDACDVGKLPSSGDAPRREVGGPN